MIDTATLRILLHASKLMPFFGRFVRRLRWSDENIGNHVGHETVDLFVIVDVTPGFVRQRDDEIA
jgi:hypothetical protein